MSDGPDRDLDGQVSLSITNHVAEITLDRPAKHNAMTPTMTEQLAEICFRVDRDEAVRVVLIKGAGDRAFCAGSDLNSLAQYETPWAFRGRLDYGMVVHGLSKPVIGALKGWVLGGGLEIALRCDIRVAARSAKFGAPEVTRGWVGGSGASQMLPRLIGYGQAMRLLLTGDRIDAEAALRLGLIEELVEDDQLAARSRALAEQIAGYSPVATQSVKASVRMALSTPLEAGLRYENEMNALCFTTSDHYEGIKAFYEKRDAKFTGS